jgi:hypothetical protein
MIKFLRKIKVNIIPEIIVINVPLNICQKGDIDNKDINKFELKNFFLRINLFENRITFDLLLME